MNLMNLVVLEDAATTNKILGMPKAVFFVLVVIVALSLIAIIYLVYFSASIKEHEQAVVERSGKYKKTVSNKLVLLFPFVDKIVYKADCRPYIYNFKDTITIIDKKESLFRVSLSVLLKIVDAKKYHYQTSNVGDVLENYACELLNEYFGKKEIKTCKDIRATHKKELIELFNKTVTDSLGIEICELYIKNIIDDKK